jgi:hypothetical protein
VRPEYITTFGTNFAISNRIIRKMLNKTYPFKFERSWHNEDQLTHNDLGTASAKPKQNAGVAALGNSAIGALS